LRTAYMLTRNWANAEDLLQDAFARAWFHWSKLDGDPEAYVRKIIVNTYVSNGRRRWRRELVSDTLPEATAPDWSHDVDERDRLWRAIGQLPPKQRAVIVLRYYEDLPEAQVAEVLGCAVGTVKSQAAKALAKLRVDTTISVVTAQKGTGA
jgi:RNA polymerase sigma-70 factor (sigma-E family)